MYVLQAGVLLPLQKFFCNAFLYMYHILAEKRTCAGQHRQNLLNKCPNMKKEHLSSLGPFFFLFLLPFFTCTVQPTCSRIKCMVLISCVHGTVQSRKKVQTKLKKTLHNSFESYVLPIQVIIRLLKTNLMA